ncbi:MAG: bifunctional metallophosphatase/5'-nucleotidase [Chloroflexi bacterium]|nr:bifunctional metallophosphatase/5'-nucleotidase [Chloroflexota bacterium]
MATPAAPQASAFRLTILHNNDGLSQLVDLGRGLTDFGGVARFAAVVQREKQAVGSDQSFAGTSGVIMVSSGDNFLAGAEFTAGLRAGTLYDAVALDLIGYDAIALGNHDFDFGPELLADFIRQVSTSQAPFLSSNLDFSDEPMLRDLVSEGRIAESVVVKVSGESIGIIGATTPDLGFISSPRKVKIIEDVVGQVQSEVDRLEASEVNKIVLISHLQDIDADIALLSQVHGVDIVVAGGGDELLANEGDLLISVEDTPLGPYPIMAKDLAGNSVPVVTAVGQYSYLGKLVVTFDADGRVNEIDDSASGPIRIARADDGVAVHPQVQRDVVDRLLKGLEGLARPIADSQVALDGRRSEVRSRATNQGNLMTDALFWQARRLAPDYGVALPDVAIQNGGGIRNDSLLPPGQIRELDTFDMAPFASIVTVVDRVSRSQFKEILENAVSQSADGDSGRFPQVSQFSFEWSESGVAQALSSGGSVMVSGARVQSATLDGGEVIIREGSVVPGLDLTVATLDFLARGGDEYPFRGAPFTTLGVTYQQALVNYIQSPAGLGGTATAADYPIGGEGRIKRLP